MKFYFTILFIILSSNVFSQSIIELNLFDEDTGERITCFNYSVNNDTLFRCDTNNVPFSLWINTYQEGNTLLEIFAIGYQLYRDTIILDTLDKQSLFIKLKRKTKRIHPDSIKTTRIGHK